MVCWYCSVREGDPKHNFGLDMYGGVGVQSSQAQTNVAYNVRHIEAPRCADCHGKHRIAKFSRGMSLVFLAVFLAALLCIVFNWIPPLIAGLCCGLAAGLVVACLLSGALVQKGILTERKTRIKHPEVKELLKANYHFGMRPKEKLPKSEPPAPVQGPDADTGN